MKVKADDVRANLKYFVLRQAQCGACESWTSSFFAPALRSSKGNGRIKKFAGVCVRPSALGRWRRCFHNTEKCLGLLGWCAAHTCLVLMPVFPLNCVALSTLIDELYVWFCVVQDHSWQLDRIFLRDTWWQLFLRSSCLCLCAGVGPFDLVERVKRRRCDNTNSTDGHSRKDVG